MTHMSRSVEGPCYRCWNYQRPLTTHGAGLGGLANQVLYLNLLASLYAVALRILTEERTPVSLLIPPDISCILPTDRVALETSSQLFELRKGGDIGDYRGEYYRG